MEPELPEPQPTVASESHRPKSRLLIASWWLIALTLILYLVLIAHMLSPGYNMFRDSLDSGFEIIAIRLLGLGAAVLAGISLRTWVRPLAFSALGLGALFLIAPSALLFVAIWAMMVIGALFGLV